MCRSATPDNAPRAGVEGQPSELRQEGSVRVQGEPSARWVKALGSNHVTATVLRDDARTRPRQCRSDLPPHIEVEGVLFVEPVAIASEVEQLSGFSRIDVDLKNRPSIWTSSLED